MVILKLVCVFVSLLFIFEWIIYYFVLVDFGLCVEMGSVDTTNMVGSPFWIPPEMVQKKSHGTPV